MKKMYTRKDVDYSYLAATLDDEGCVRVRLRKGNKLDVTVSVQMTDIAPLELFKFYFKGGLRKKKNKTKGGLPVFRYFASHRRAENILRELLPFLLVKKERADLGLRICEIKLSHGGNDLRSKEKLLLARKLNMMNSSKGGVSKVVRITEAMA